MEDVRTYIHCKLEYIGDKDIMSEFDNVYKQDMKFKEIFEHLG